MPVSAEVIADSISPEGSRCTSIQGKIHRFMLAEVNTHRYFSRPNEQDYGWVSLDEGVPAWEEFSRNSASSRAIPYQKMRIMVLEDPAYPLSWPAEQKGMQGGEELDEETLALLRAEWRSVLNDVVAATDYMHGLGLHKSVVNRLLEPWMWHTVLITATDWQGFFEQRCSPGAQPEIRAFAEAVRVAMASSTPEPLRHGSWHLPYIRGTAELEEIHAAGAHPLHVSAARCARTSYLTQDGKRDFAEDESLYHRLVSAQPPHWSPLEHVARPLRQRESFAYRDDLRMQRNLRGWVQLRTECENGR